MVAGCWLRLGVIVACAGRALPGAEPGAADLGEWLREPSVREWQSLTRFDATLTRREFVQQIELLYDPGKALVSFLKILPEAVEITIPPGAPGEPAAAPVIIHFAAAPRAAKPRPVAYREVAAVRAGTTRDQPLRGLRIALEPADIGGAWGRAEDRSVDFPGYGRISEGDLNLTVARALEQRLGARGAIVFLIRDRAEPVSGLTLARLSSLEQELPGRHPEWLTPALRERAAALSRNPDEQLRLATDLLLTKTVETRARVAYLRRSFTPDLTLVLQHNATAESSEARLTPRNRNIFFVPGAFTPEEVADPAQRWRLLQKVFERASPVEIAAAAAIAEEFRRVTGFAAVQYGNSRTTRLVLPDNNYVVARNLAFLREHDGPVIVTEPYFMNQPETLARLLAGDYPGTRLVAGADRPSIFAEYADCVTAGLVSLYRPAR